MPLVGDYNQNHIVDAADYTVWRNMLGQVGYHLAADGNGDGRVDESDYGVWKNHFGEVWSGSGNGSGAGGTCGRAGANDLCDCLRDDAGAACRS